MKDFWPLGLAILAAGILFYCDWSNRRFQARRNRYASGRLHYKPYDKDDPRRREL